MVAHGRGEPGRGHWTQSGLFFERIAQFIAGDAIDESLDETIVKALVHIDALDAAAALSGIEERPVDKILDREFESGVGAHIGRVLAAEFQAERGERSGRGAFDRAAARHRSREIDMIDAARADHPRRRFVIHDEMREQTFGQVGAVHGSLESVADENGLRCMFQDDRIASEQRRRDRIDGSQIGIVPRRDDKHDPRRHALDQAAKARLLSRNDRSQRLIADLDEGADALLDAAHFAAIAHRASHLHGELRRDFLILRQHRFKECGDRGLALGERRGRPFALRGAGRGQDRFDFGERSWPPARNLPAVDGGNTDNIVHASSVAESIDSSYDSDDLEIAREFPVGDRTLELAFFPAAAHRVMFDENIAEQIARWF
jgi:hypothetical protein